MKHEDISPPMPAGGDLPPGELPINTDEQPSGRESGPLQSGDEKRKGQDPSLVPPPQPEDNDV